MRTILRWLRGLVGESPMRLTAQEIGIKLPRRLLGIRSPSEDAANILGPIALANALEVMAYSKAVIDYLQESTTNDAE